MDAFPPFIAYRHTEEEFLAGLRRTTPAGVEKYLGRWLTKWRQLLWPSSSSHYSPDIDLLHRHALRIVPWDNQTGLPYFREHLRTPDDIAAVIDNPNLPNFLSCLLDLSVPKDLAWPGFSRFRYDSHGGHDPRLLLVEALSRKNLLPAGFIKQTLELDQKATKPRPKPKRTKHGWPQELLDQAYYGEASPFLFGTPDEATVAGARHFLHRSAFIAIQTPEDIFEFINWAQLPKGAWFSSSLANALYYQKNLTSAHIDAIMAKPLFYELLHNSLVDHPHTIATPAYYQTLRQTAHERLTNHLEMSKKSKRGDHLENSDARLDGQALARIILSSPVQEGYDSWLLLAKAYPHLAWETLEHAKALRKHLLAAPALYVPLAKTLLPQSQSDHQAEETLYEIIATLPPEDAAPFLATLASRRLDDVIGWLATQPLERRQLLQAPLKKAIAKELTGADRERRLLVITKLGELFGRTDVAPPPKRRRSL